MAMVPTALIKVDGDRLGRCRVQDGNGTEIELGSLWRENTAILVFLRHFACVACRAHALQVWAEREKYEKGGAKLTFIGNGTASFLLRFKEELGDPSVPVYTDPSIRSFAAAGFKRGFLAALGATSIGNMGIMIVRGEKPKIPTPGHGDLWQLGGILVVRQGSRVVYQYISEAVGDFPPEKDEPHISDSDDVAAVTG